MNDILSPLNSVDKFTWKDEDVIWELEDSRINLDNLSDNELLSRGEYDPKYALIIYKRYGCNSLKWIKDALSKTELVDFEERKRYLRNMANACSGCP